MLYIVECGFADPAREAEWNAWYSGPKLSELLAVPGFRAAQRFRALDAEKSPYLNLTSIETAEMFTNPSYRSQGGGRFGPWDLALIIDWRRLLFTGMEEMPPVPEGHCLCGSMALPKRPRHWGSILAGSKGSIGSPSRVTAMGPLSILRCCIGAWRWWRPRWRKRCQQRRVCGCMSRFVPSGLLDGGDQPDMAP